ncbi:MAG: protein-export chaperone SecB [Gammaproteobacteria bacterium]|jgi:preprotein translocase subunit SecB|nr:protein-export chaperone SecB [Gammaproteobacteria bacterium]
MSTANPTPSANGDLPERLFGLERIYLKDCSFESPRAPASLASPPPSVELNIQNTVNIVPGSEDLREVVLTLTLTGKDAEAIVFVAEVQQAGLFLVRGFPQEELEAILNIYAPGQLYPYARESISNLVLHGGFPPFVLQPINFEDVYRHRQGAPASPPPL